MTKDNRLVFPCLPFPRIVPVSTSVINGPFPKASFNTVLVELRSEAKELLKNWNSLGSLKETPLPPAVNNEAERQRNREVCRGKAGTYEYRVYFLTGSHFLFYADWVCSVTLLWSSHSSPYPSSWLVPQSQAQNFTRWKSGHLVS